MISKRPTILNICAYSSEQTDFKEKIVHKLMKFLFVYWRLFIFTIIIMNSIIFFVQIIKNGKILEIQLILNLSSFVLIVTGIFCVYKFIGKKKFSIVFHDISIFVYLILSSLTHMYFNLENNNSILQQGKYYFLFANKLYYIAVFIPWLTICNMKIKIFSFICMELIFIFYTLAEITDNYEDCLKTILFFIFQVIICFKICNINEILFDVIDEGKIDLNNQWRRIIDETASSLVILEKESRKILFMNKQAKRLVESDFLETNHYLSCLERKLGRVRFAQNSDSISFYIRTASNLNQRLMAEEMSFHCFSLPELFEFLNEFSSKFVEEETIYLERAEKSNKNANFIRFIINFNFNGLKCHAIFIDDNATQNHEEKIVDKYERDSLGFSIELKAKLDESISYLEEKIDSKYENEKSLKNWRWSTLNSMKKANLILKSMIDFNSLKKNELILKSEKLNLKTFLFGIFSLFEKSCQEKNIQLTQKIDKDLKDFINSDKERISIILYNLLSNSIKNTNKGHITLHISRFSQEQIRFSIIDTAKSMKQDQVNHMKNLFSPNLRKEGLKLIEADLILDIGVLLSNSLARLLSNKTPKNQTGIFINSNTSGNVFSFLIFDDPDLQHKYEIPHKHEISFIKIEAEVKEQFLSQNASLELSNPSFYLNHSVDKQENNNQIKINIPLFPEINTKAQNNSPKHKTQCECPSILVVDDDTFNQLSLKLILKSFKLKSQTANHGLEAIDILTKRKNETRCSKNYCLGFQFVFMDYEMPVMGGVESTQKIRELISKGIVEDVRIIGCTAYGTFLEIELFKASGIDDLLVKPIQIENIKNILRKWSLNFIF